jgi:signal transduction histidine kinase
MSTPEKISVLVIEEDPVYGKFLQQILSESEAPQFLLRWAKTFEEGMQILASSSFDILLAGLSLSVYPHRQPLTTLQANAGSTPILVLTAVPNENLAIEAMNLGAQDTLLKSDVNPRMLARVIRYAIGRKRAEDSLRKAFAQMEQVLSAIPSILIELDARGIVTHWNTAAETTFGILESAALHCFLENCRIRWEFNKIQKGLEKCLLSEQPVKVEDILYHSLVGERYLGFTIIPIQVDQKTTRFILFGTDITERKRLDNLKYEFISIVSHELRTPITLIREGISLVLDNVLGATTSEQKKFLSLSLETIDRLSRIVNDLLDISQMEAGRLELRKTVVDLQEIIRKVEAVFAPLLMNKDLKIRVSFPGKVSEVYADYDKVIQIVTNLMQNAVKFTEKGFIDIAVKEMPHEVECSIADTGQGIAAEDMPMVFSQFKQFGKPSVSALRSAGLGLSICKKIVELHGGKIHVESVLGQGSKFTFSLPKKSA